MDVARLTADPNSRRRNGAPYQSAVKHDLFVEIHVNKIRDPSGAISSANKLKSRLSIEFIVGLSELQNRKISQAALDGVC